VSRAGTRRDRIYRKLKKEQESASKQICHLEREINRIRALKNE
jgi:predicted transcriptional regulator